MKKFLLSLTMVFVVLCANAQRGYKTVYNPQKGRIVEFSDNVISQRGGETKGDANVVWSLSEEYAIGDNVYAFDIDDNEDHKFAINWSLNDPRIDGFTGENNSPTWQIPTTTDSFTTHFANKSGNIQITAEETVIYVSDGNGNITKTHECSENSYAAARNDDAGYYLAIRTNNNTEVSYYTLDSNTASWTTTLAGNVVGMSISAECNRLVVSVAQPEETIYVLEPETGDILQDDIYYYDNSPTQSPALSANGDYLAFSDFSGQGTLMHWNGERYELVWKTNITSSYASSSWGCGNAISADGKYVAFGTLDFVSSGYDGTVFFFNSYSPIPLWTYENCGGQVSELSMASDGSLLAVASDGPVDNSGPDAIIFRKQTNEPYMELNTSGSLTNIDLSTDGKYCLTAGKAVHSTTMGWGGNAYLIKTGHENVGTLAGEVILSGETSHKDVTVTIDGIDNYYELTDEDGIFNIRFIPVGTYNVTVSKTGYVQQTIDNVVINGETTTTISCTLEPVGMPLTGLHATINSNDKVFLFWNDFGGSFEHYAVYRKDAIEAAFGEPIGFSEENAYYDDTALPTKQYFYAVTAILGDNMETPYSNIAEGSVSTDFIVTEADAYQGTAATIDGQKGTDEWIDASVVDISDFLGNSNEIEPAGSVLFYCKTNNNKLYGAVEVFTDTELEADDCVALYVDDNGNRTFPPQGDDSEGNYWLTYTGNGTSMTYRPIYENGSVGTTIDVFDQELAFGTVDGHVFVEFSLEFGDETYMLSPINDKSGFYIYYRSHGSDYHAYWPYDVSTFDASTYNMINYNVQHNAPETPTNLEAVVCAGDDYYAIITWDNVESNDLDHYNIYINNEIIEVKGNMLVTDVEYNTTYNVKATAVDHSGLESEESEIITFSVGDVFISETLVSTLRIFPNPASSTINICSNFNDYAEINMYDISGRIVKRCSLNNLQNTSVDVENLIPGLYIMEIITKEMAIIKKITIK